MKSKLFSLLFVLAFCFGSHSVRAQEPEDTVRIDTRVVFVDAIVKDKRTGESIPDLKQENFEVLADGKPRTLSYFTREGDAGRKPLALVIVIDLRQGGAARYLRRADILEAMAAELAKLPAGDEVAVRVIAGQDDKNRPWLTGFTRDRKQVAKVLTSVPLLITRGISAAYDPDIFPEGNKPDGTTEETTTEIEVGIGAGGEERVESEIQDDATASATPEGGGGDVVSETKMVGKNGDTVIRTVHKDGRVSTKRVSKSGKVSMSFGGEFALARASRDAARLAASERPNSRMAVVWVSDGIAPIFYAERDDAVQALTKADITFSALVTDMKTKYKLFMPIIKPIGNVVGISLYGSAQHIAKQTGGEALRVNRPADYAQGLRQIMGNLTGRYSLGFTLAEGERDDGQMHPLEVRIAARDAKGKPRKLDVTARRGYFMPKADASEQPRTHSLAVWLEAVWEVCLKHRRCVIQ